jgi:hypothetical protein
MLATASTAAAVERRMARSMLVVTGATGSLQSNAWPSARRTPRAVPGNSACWAAARIEQRSGLVISGVEHGLLLRDRLGGIWEVASGANQPEPVPTELKQSL